MNYQLLLGAGFSRNWGGWLSTEVFEYLLGCREIKRDPYLRTLMWQWFGRGGFEYTLGDVQRNAAANPTVENNRRLANMNTAVSRMLADMNASMVNRRLEFQIGENL